MKFLKICKVRCKKCGDILGREYEDPNERGGPMAFCSCGAIGFDPDPILWKVAGCIEDCEKLFEVADKNNVGELTFEEALKHAAEELLDEEAQAFLQNGTPDENVVRDVTSTPLTPGQPKICLGNGEFPGFECCCDECDYLGKCFADQVEELFCKRQEREA